MKLSLYSKKRGSINLPIIINKICSKLISGFTPDRGKQKFTFPEDRGHLEKCKFFFDFKLLNSKGSLFEWEKMKKKFVYMA